MILMTDNEDEDEEQAVINIVLNISDMATEGDESIMMKKKVKQKTNHEEEG